MGADHTQIIIVVIVIILFIVLIIIFMFFKRKKKPEPDSVTVIGPQNNEHLQSNLHTGPLAVPPNVNLNQVKNSNQLPNYPITSPTQLHKVPPNNPNNITHLKHNK